MATAPVAPEESPFAVPELAPGLYRLRSSSRAESARSAQDAVVLADLAARVPRVLGDERGGSAWTSFLREVAVARRCSDRAAAGEVARACQLVQLPLTLSLLAAGDLPVLQARALVEESWPAGPATLARIDAEVSAVAVRLSPSRVRDAVRKVLLREEADAAAVRAIKATAMRSVVRRPLADDQAELVLTGPALPLAQLWAALDHDARALRAAGDERPLDALRFDLAVDRGLAHHVEHTVAAPGSRPAAPGTSTPGTSTPGTATPGTATPGTATPGTATPGTSTPQSSSSNPPAPTSAPSPPAPNRPAPNPPAPGAPDDALADDGGPRAAVDQPVSSPPLRTTAAPTPAKPATPALPPETPVQPVAPGVPPRPEASPAEVPPSALPVPEPPPATDSPSWLTDRRFSRPVRLDIGVPVTTALGLSNEPGWLDGHGWISAPTCRQLLVAAELRRLCLDDGSGQLVDVAPDVLRPAPTPEAVAAALRDVATRPFDITDTSWQEQPQHDPGDALRELVALRDEQCDGPTGARVPARRADKDHDTRWPQGPTAAWNLVARSRRTHQLKHRGWQPVRTSTSTLWFSPAGQVVEVARTRQPLQPVERDAVLPDPVALHALEAELLRPPIPDDDPPDW